MPGRAVHGSRPAGSPAGCPSSPSSPRRRHGAPAAAFLCRAALVGPAILAGLLAWAPPLAAANHRHAVTQDSPPTTSSSSKAPTRKRLHGKAASGSRPAQSQRRKRHQEPPPPRSPSPPRTATARAASAPAARAAPAPASAGGSPKAAAASTSAAGVPTAAALPGQSAVPGPAAAGAAMAAIVSTPAAGAPVAAAAAAAAATSGGAPVAAPPPIPSKGLRLRLREGVYASFSADGQLAVDASPHDGEGLAGFAQRLCGDARLAPQVLEANHLPPGSSLKTGRPYHLPFDLLAASWQLEAARALFPQDRGDATGWRHQVRGVGALRRENLWELSEWFTGKGENFRAIREYNNLRDEDVTQGAVLTIPSELLRPAFGAALPVPQKPYVLAYGKDQDGDYAVYRLRPGEALYSGVVVRFTGRIYAADVNALAADIAHRSGIDDVTAIPVGFKVKIPLDLLQPEFLPEGDPRRKEYEASLRASSHFSNQVRAKGLEGITVILDAGHGGHDAGATMGSVWESLYVYDIALRLKRLLESHTAAAVELTTRDGDDFRIVDADVLPASRGHAVLTNPPYPIEDPVVGVNLRWYLANSFFRRALSAADDPQKIVFLSIHADSLHPSLRGAMAYIPAARMRDESYGKSGAIYEARQEFRESPRVDFPWNQRVQSEGLSRQLAKQVIGAFEELGLPVHPFTPVRDRIIRKRSEWVPAVLRYNSVPSKMLLEVCNLNNDLDRRLLQTRGYRQNVAQAVMQGLLAYYGQSASSPAVRVARAAK
jgi:N-acetylmuramoyl-L-alanine amidase